MAELERCSSDYRDEHLWRPAAEYGAPDTGVVEQQVCAYCGIGRWRVEGQEWVVVEGIDHRTPARGGSRMDGPMLDPAGDLRPLDPTRTLLLASLEAVAQDVDMLAAGVVNFPGDHTEFVGRLKKATMDWGRMLARADAHYGAGVTFRALTDLADDREGDV